MDSFGESKDGANKCQLEPLEILTSAGSFETEPKHELAARSRFELWCAGATCWPRAELVSGPSARKGRTSCCCCCCCCRCCCCIAAAAVVVVVVVVAISISISSPIGRPPKFAPNSEGTKLLPPLASCNGNGNSSSNNHNNNNNNNNNSKAQVQVQETSAGTSAQLADDLLRLVVVRRQTC